MIGYNIEAHYFIPAQYWKSNFELVKELLLQATVYVYDDKSAALRCKNTEKYLLTSVRCKRRL